MLFATFRFLMKLQTRTTTTKTTPAGSHNQDPTLNQVFLAALRFVA
jgi:hypothetical protein